MYNSIYFENYGAFDKPRTWYPSWVPAFDNFDGTEKFWCLYEKTRIPDEMQATLNWGPDLLCKDVMVSSYFIWVVVIYYALLVVGGNEL